MKNTILFFNEEHTFNEIFFIASVFYVCKKSLSIKLSYNINFTRNVYEFLGNTKFSVRCFVYQMATLDKS